MKGIRILLASLAMLQLCSCVGVQVPYGRRTEVGPEQRGSLAALPTQDAVLKARGHPTAINRADDKEYWHYNGRMAWRGIVIYFVIPVCLVVPTGHDEVVYEFVNGVRTNTVVEASGVFNFLCGVFGGEEPALFGCVNAARGPIGID